MFRRGGTTGEIRAGSGFSVHNISAEGRALSQERDPEIYDSGLLILGQRLEAENRLEEASQIYATLVTDPSPSRERVPEGRVRASFHDIRRRAQAHLDALTGVGSSTHRTEFLLRNLARETLEPTTLVGMTAASTVFRMTRLATFSRLIGNPTTHFATRGFGARALASLTAFGAEATVFPLATRGAAMAMGQNLDWSPVQVGKEIAGSFLILGSMKLTGWAASHGTGPARFLSRQTGMFAGITLGHRLETAAGLRHPVDGATTFVDSLAMLVQVNVAGRLAQGIMGEGFRNWELEMDHHPRNLIVPRIPAPSRSVISGTEVLAFPSPLVGEGPRRGGEGARLRDLHPPKPLQMSTLGGPGGSGAPDFSERRLAQILSKKFELPDDDPAVLRITRQYKKTKFHFREDESRHTYYELLRRSQLRSMVLFDGSERSASSLLSHAAEVFRYAMELNPLRRATGSFYDYMVQIAFERVIRENRLHAFDQLVRVVAFHQSVEAIETFLRDHNLHYPFEFKSGLWKVSLFKRPEWIKILDSLKLPKTWRNLIGNYLATYKYGEFSGPFNDPNYNYLLLHPKGQEPRREPMDARYAVLSLQNLFAKERGNQDLIKLLESCWQRASDSRLPVLYLDRMFKVIATGDLEEKLHEMAKAEEFSEYKLKHHLKAGPAHDPQLWVPAAKINGTVYTGYVNDQGTARKFAVFYHWLPVLTRPEGLEQRRSDFRALADRLLMGKKNFGREEVLDLLYHRPTEGAQLARKAILEGEVDFEVLSKETMEDLWIKLQGKKKFPEAPSGIFLPPEKSGTGRPYIAIQELDPNLSRDEKIARAVYLAAFTVHEFEHFQHGGELDFRYPRPLLLGELRAWLEENLYLLMQGESSEWEEAERLSPQGFGIYLRNLIDRDYIQGPRDLVMVRTK